MRHDRETNKKKLEKQRKIRTRTWLHSYTHAHTQTHKQTHTHTHKAVRKEDIKWKQMGRSAEHDP